MTQKGSASLAFFLAAVLGVPLAQAALISVDDPVFGAGSVTRDTDTGLEWLDLTSSTGRSYDQVSVEFSVGGDFAGWRYGTESELNQLFFSSADIPVGPHSPHGKLSDLQSLVGITDVANSVSFGLYDDSTDGTEAEVVGSATLIIGVGGDGSLAEAFIIADDLPPSEPDSSTGSWLVRVPAPPGGPIPEPTTLAIWSVLGGIGLVVGHRRRKRKAA